MPGQRLVGLCEEFRYQTRAARTACARGDLAIAGGAPFGHLPHRGQNPQAALFGRVLSHDLRFRGGTSRDAR